MTVDNNHSVVQASIIVHYILEIYALKLKNQEPSDLYTTVLGCLLGVR